MSWELWSKWARSLSCSSRRRMPAADADAMSTLTGPAEERRMAKIQTLEAGGRKATDFDDAFRARLSELLVWRRDIRCFRKDPITAGSFEGLMDHGYRVRW